MAEMGKGIGSMSDIPVGAGGAVFNSDAVTVAPRACFFCCARKSRQKEALGDAPYCALTRAILFDALFGRRIATVPIAFASDECTTRSCGQTASISILLISGILDGPM